MKYKTILYSLLIFLLTILSIYFIAANVFNLKTIYNRGIAYDISSLKIQ
jgi:hypothetical protein